MRSANFLIFGMLLYSVQKLHLLVLLHPANSFLLESITRKHSIAVPFMAKTTKRCDNMPTSTANEKAAVLHQNCHDDNDKRRHQRRSLRRKIPYVESFEEQTTRELWEENPFSGTEHVIDAIVGSESDGDSRDRSTNSKAILTKIKSEISESEIHQSKSPSSSAFQPLSGYEDSFNLLYKTRTGDDVDPESDEFNANRRTNSIKGTVSIAASPFAITADNKNSTTEKQNHFCLRVAYRGDNFCGWQTQRNNFEKPSVQRTLEEWLTELQNDQPLGEESNTETKRKRRAEKRERKAMAATTEGGNMAISNETNHTKKYGSTPRSSRIKWADLPVAGRTDASVSAIGQLCRFRTYCKDLSAEQIKEYLNDRVEGTPRISRSLRVTEITRVSKAFHPTFTTSSRAYAYLIDASRGSNNVSPLSPSTAGNFSGYSRPGAFGLLAEERIEQQVELLDGMLRKIEGKSLDYIGLSYGRVKTLNTICTLYHARARLVEYKNRAVPSAAAGVQDERTITKAICIELVGDRFLRRMVRLLVEASLRLVATADFDATRPNPGREGTTTKMTDLQNEAHEGRDKENGEPTEDALLKLIERQDRSLVGRPAPPNGLIFVAARLQSD